MLPRSTSTRTGASTRKTFITSAYPLQGRLRRHPHRPRHLLPHLRLPLLRHQLRRRHLRLLRHRGRSPSVRVATRCKGRRRWTFLGMELPRTTSTYIATARRLPLCRTSPVSTPIPTAPVGGAATPIRSAKQALKTALTRSR